MIIKQLSRSATKSNASSIRQLIKYVLDYTNAGNAPQKDATILLKHNLAYKKNTEDYIRSFCENEKLRKHRREKNIILQHAIFSFSPQDHEKVTTDILKQVAEKWVDLTAPNCLALAVAHRKENKHAHVVISAVATDGKSNRKSKADFALALQLMEAYQAERFPFLSQSIINHEKKYSNSKEIQSKESVKLKLRRELQNYLLHTEKQLKHETYFRNERLQGILYKGKKYRLSTIGLSQNESKDLETYIMSLKEIQNMRNQDLQQESEFEKLRNRRKGMGISHSIER